MYDEHARSPWPIPIVSKTFSPELGSCEVCFRYQYDVLWSTTARKLEVNVAVGEYQGRKLDVRAERTVLPIQARRSHGLDEKVPKPKGVRIYGHTSCLGLSLVVFVKDLIAIKFVLTNYLPSSHYMRSVPTRFHAAKLSPC